MDRPRQREVVETESGAELGGAVDIKGDTCTPMSKWKSRTVQRRLLVRG